MSTKGSPRATHVADDDDGGVFGPVIAFEKLPESLAKFKLPQAVQFVEGPLPKTGTGKILKRDLRETFWSGKARRVQG